MKLTFKDYYESKVKLIEAVDLSPRVKLKYKLNKYCKIPVYEAVDSNDRDYISLKLDEEVEILWEYDTLDTPTVRYIRIIETKQTFIPAWNSGKMFNWVVHNTEEL